MSALARLRHTPVPWRPLAFVVGFNLALAGWFALGPTVVDRTVSVQTLAELLGSLAILAVILRPGPGAPARPMLHRSRLALTLGIAATTLGLVVTLGYQLLHRSTFGISLNDLAFLSTYPLYFLGVLWLPGAVPLGVSRTRRILDVALLLVAVAILSWYFLLAPTLMAGGVARLVVVVDFLYPLSDLVLIASVLLLWDRRRAPAAGVAVVLLSVAFVVLAATDSIFDFAMLHGTYRDSSVLDVGWTLGTMLVGLAVLALARVPARGRAAAGLIPAADPAAASASLAGYRSARWWLNLGPYLLLPVDAWLFLITWNTPGDGDELREWGVAAGALLLIGLIVARQMLSFREMGVLNRELSGANQQLANLAITDPLTDLANHRAVMIALERETARAYRYRRPFGLVLLDLDHFKALNDGYGHAAGDGVLREVARVLRHTARGVDLVSRVGGEEFLIIVPESTRQETQALAERLREALAQHRFAIGGGAHLTGSFGVVAYPDDGTNRDRLLARADEALYAAKRLGRNQVRAGDDPAVIALADPATATLSREEVALTGTIEALAALVEARDRYTGQHTRLVAALAVRVALELGLDTNAAHMVGVAGLLHDVGKISVPDAILQKPAQLAPAEWAIVREHPTIGADVVGRVPGLRALAPLIRGHHERWDGTGYPDGLAGEAIPLGARVIAAVDAYSAMTTSRPYRAARDTAWARAELARFAGRQFDPAVIAALDRTLGAAPATDEALVAQAGPSPAFRAESSARLSHAPAGN